MKQINFKIMPHSFIIIDVIDRDVRALVWIMIRAYIWNTVTIKIYNLVYQNNLF